MATKSKSPKWTTAQKKEHVDKIQKLLKKFKLENKLENFTGITPEQTEKKFKRINSPMIVGQSWGNSTPGGTVSYNVFVYNPDPVTAIWLFVHVWVGSGNIDPDTGTFLLNVDTRFPQLTEKATTGFSLAPGTSTTLSFSLAVSSGIPKTGYIGNSCLMQLNWHDTGKYLDRGVFVFAIS